MKTILIVYTEPRFRCMLEKKHFINGYRGVFNNVFINTTGAVNYSVYDDEFETFKLMNNVKVWRNDRDVLLKLFHCQQFFSKNTMMEQPINSFLKEKLHNNQYHLVLIHTSSYGNEKNCRWNIISEAIRNYKEKYKDNFNVITVYIGINSVVDTYGTFNHKCIIYHGVREFGVDDVDSAFLIVKDFLEDLYNKEIYPATKLGECISDAEYILPSSELGNCPICGKSVEYFIEDAGEELYTRVQIRCSVCNFSLMNDEVGAEKEDWHKLISRWTSRKCYK